MSGRKRRDRPRTMDEVLRQAQAMEMLSNCHDSVPHIFLITDGAVEDERNICQTMKTNITSRESMSPRISTFGIDLVGPRKMCTLNAKAHLHLPFPT